MDEVETQFLKTQKLKPLLWLRHIGDIFFIWTHGEEQLKTFMNNFNNYKSNLKFTYECSKNEINFLDLKVKFEKRSFNTSVYIKSTDRHQHLHYRSSHRDHIKRSPIYSQALRVNILRSREKDFVGHTHKIKSWFEK